MPTDFFCLPVELRFQIYEYALDEVTKQPTDPWEQAPLCSSYSTFVSLVTLGSPLSDDVQGLFSKKYARRLHFYFDDVLRLHDFKQWASRHCGLRDLRFCLRVSRHSHPEWYDDYYYSDNLCEDTSPLQEDAVVQLVDSQPGYHEDWRLYHYQHHDRNDPGLRTLDEYANNLPNRFRVRRGTIGMRRPNEVKSANYLAIDFPPSLNHLQLTLYEQERRAGHTRHQSNFHQCYFLKPIMELRGRIVDLTFEGLDVDILRAKVYYTRDSPWGRRCWSRSPDLEEEEREEMDADSWSISGEEESASETEADSLDGA